MPGLKIQKGITFCYKNDAQLPCDLAHFSVMNRNLDVYRNLIEMLRPEVDMDNSDFCGKSQ